MSQTDYLCEPFTIPHICVHQRSSAGQLIPGLPKLIRKTKYVASRLPLRTFHYSTLLRSSALVSGTINCHIRTMNPAAETHHFQADKSSFQKFNFISRKALLKQNETATFGTIKKTK